MGFKSNASKRRKATTVSSGNSKTEKKEYIGEIKCDVADCDKWADKKVGGRKKAYDWAVDVWGDSGLSNESRRVTLCKACYKIGKKHKKDEPDSWS